MAHSGEGVDSGGVKRPLLLSVPTVSLWAACGYKSEGSESPAVCPGELVA